MRQNDLVEALFAAYFGDGRDIGDEAVLAAIAGEAGLDGARAAAMLAGSEGAAQVHAEIERAAALGISGVPTVMASGRPLFSGAIRSELIARHLRRAASEGGGDQTALRVLGSNVLPLGPIQPA